MLPNTFLSVKERKEDDWEKEKSESWRQAVSKLSRVFHSMILYNSEKLEYKISITLKKHYKENNFFFKWHFLICTL